MLYSCVWRFIVMLRVVLFRNVSVWNWAVYSMALSSRVPQGCVDWQAHLVYLSSPYLPPPSPPLSLTFIPAPDQLVSTPAFLPILHFFLFRAENAPSTSFNILALAIIVLQFKHISTKFIYTGYPLLTFLCSSLLSR